jgi:hypothetical protein
MQDFLNRDSRDSVAKPPPAVPSQTFSAIVVAPIGFAKGYPTRLSKKSRARVVTYRQCDHQHFEKTPGPLKRKDFMKIFLSSRADYDSAPARFDSARRFSPLPSYPESRCLILRTRS